MVQRVLLLMAVLVVPAMADYVTIPAGSFEMGGRDGTTDPTQAYIDEDPKFVATVPYDFEIWRDEITNAEYAAFLNAYGANEDADGHRFLDTGDPQVRIHLAGDTWIVDSGWANHPVTEVSWYGADAYCKWVGGRLPTEEEWEKAARWNPGANRSTIWPWGDTFSCGYSAMWWCISPRNTWPVGSFPLGNNAYGLRDMAGNVWEWTQGGYRSHPNSPLGDFADPTREVTKGGSWTNSDYNQRSASKSPQPRYMTDTNTGFRVVRSAVNPAVLPLPDPNVAPPQVWREEFNSPIALAETKVWWGNTPRWEVEPANSWFVSSLEGATYPTGESMARIQRDLSAIFQPGDVVDISVRYRFERGDRDFARAGIAIAWGNNRTIDPGGRGADENTGYPWYLLANNSDAPNVWHTVKGERYVWGSGAFQIGFTLWANLTDQASPPIVNHQRLFLDWIQVEHSPGADVTPRPTSTPTLTPTPRPTPEPSPEVVVLRGGTEAAGVQVYFAAADVTAWRDEAGAAPSVELADASVGNALSPWAPGGLDASPGYLDANQCGATGEVASPIGYCTSNNIQSPFGNLALAKPDGSSSGAFALDQHVSAISSADPRIPFNENSSVYRSWVKYRVRLPQLLNASKVYLWIRAYKPTLQSNPGEDPFDDDSCWLVGSPEPSVANRTLFYLADDNDGPGDNDGPDRGGASAQVLNNCGLPETGMGQWFWGNSRVSTGANLGLDWCSVQSRRLTNESGVHVLHMTVPNDGFGHGIVEFYLVGREAETVAEALKFDLVCLSTVGPPAFVPSDDSWNGAAVVPSPTPVSTATPTATPTPEASATPTASATPAPTSTPEPHGASWSVF